MKLRPLFLIIVTLLIGFVIGFLTSAQLRHKRMQSVRIYSSEDRFRNDAFKFIQPSDEQISQISPIIKKYVKLNRDLQRDYRSNFEGLMQDFFAEIKPFLSQEQLDHIENMEKMRKEATNRFRRDSGGSREYRSDSSFRYMRGDSSIRYNRGDTAIRNRHSRPGGESH